MHLATVLANTQPDRSFFVSYSEELSQNFYILRQLLWSEWGDSNARSLEPKPMSEPSDRPVAPSLVLSVTPAVTLWNSFALFASDTAFVFWDLCGMKFCILKMLPTGIAFGGGRFCHRDQLRNCVA